MGRHFITPKLTFGSCFPAQEGKLLSVIYSHATTHFITPKLTFGSCFPAQEGKLLSVIYRNPTLLHLMWADETKLITASPETPGTITMINFW